MKFLFYLLLWCAVDGQDILNCSEERDICEVYDDVNCMKCVESDFTDCSYGVTSYE